MSSHSSRSRLSTAVTALLANMTTTTTINSKMSSPSSHRLHFAVHSTFRDPRSGRQLLPDGLEWGLPGESTVAYVAMSTTRSIDKKNNGEHKRSNGTTTSIADDHEDGDNDDHVKRAILHAHNRWLFAKDLPFRRLDDMVRVDKVEKKEGEGSAAHYYLVEWKDDDDNTDGGGGACPVETRNYHPNVPDLLAEHVNNASSNATSAPAPEVWINGVFCDTLTPDSLDRILREVQRIPSRKLCFKSSSSSSDGQSSTTILRIDRYFRGGLHHRDDVFDHIMDNLIALEDPVTIGNSTLIGTATLPDWIMGGRLTSRLLVQERENGNILFLRPLHRDDPATSDRRFELVRGGPDDNAKIDLVRPELQRLRFLAKLPSPYHRAGVPAKDDDDKEPGIVYSSDESLAESERSRQHRRNRRKKFTL